MKWLIALTLTLGCATPPRPVGEKAGEKTGAVSTAPAKAWQRTPPPAALAAVPRSRPEVFTRTLKNGLKVVVVEDHRARLVQTRLFFPSGSAGDPEDQEGATWFALALLGDTFDQKDEEGQPVRETERSARYMAMMSGASLRFEVTADSSWIGLDGFSVDINLLLKRLATVVSDRRHGADAFEGRAQGVADTLNELELTDGTVLEQYLGQLAFGAEHPYARPVYGTPSSISRLGLEEVTRRQNRLLTPVGATLLVAGGVRSDDIFSRVQQAFGGWKGGAPDRVSIRPAVATKRRSVVFLPRKPSRNTLVCLTRPLSDALGSNAAVTLAIASVGQRMSGLLREKLGLTYSLSASLVRRRVARALLICSRVRATETTDAARIMLEELSSFAGSPPTTDELVATRAMAITEAQTRQDDLSGIVAAWQEAAVMKWTAPPETEVAELEAVTLEDVGAVAKALATTDTVQVIFSGEKGLVEAAARANGLGALKVPTLGKVE